MKRRLSNRRSNTVYFQFALKKESKSCASDLISSVWRPLVDVRDTVYLLKKALIYRAEGIAMQSGRVLKL